MVPGSRFHEKLDTDFSNDIRKSTPRVDSRSTSDDSTAPSNTWTTNPRKPKYYVPVTARVPWLIAVLVAVVACIAVLETAVQTGDRGGRPDDDDLDRRWLKRQEEGNASSSIDQTSITDSTSDFFTIQTSNPSNTANYQTASSKFVTISTSSDDVTATTASEDFVAISTSSETSSEGSEVTNAPSAAKTASDGDGGYVVISTSSDSVMYNRPTSDFITLSSSGSGDVSVFSKASSEYIGIVTTITSDGSPIAALPATITSDGTTFTSLETIDDDEITAASAAPTDYQTITEGLQNKPTEIPTTLLLTSTTTLEDGSLETVTRTSVGSSPAPTAPGEIKSSQIQISSSFTEVDYFYASYLAVLVAVVLKNIWAMVFASMKMMEPFFYLARPEGATVKDSLLAEYLSTGYSFDHIRHIFSGHWLMLLGTIAYLGFAVLPPLSTEASTVVATAFCTNPNGDQQPCNPVWVLNSSFVRGLEAVLCVIAAMIVALIFLSWGRKSGIFADPSSLATMASLLSHEDTLHDLRQLEQSATDKQLAHALNDAHYTLSSYEMSPGSGLYRYGICKTSSSSASTPYSLERFRNFDGASRSHYSALNNPSDYSLPPSFPSPMQVNTKNDPVTASTVPFSLPKRTVRDIIFLAALLALFGVIIAYYFDGSSSGFNNFFNSHSFGPGFILTGAAVIVDFHWKTLEREVRILVPYQNLGHRIASPEKSVLVNIGGTALQNLPKALYRGEWFHALIAGTAVLSDFLIVAVGGVPYSTAQVWQAFLTSAYLSMTILAIMVLSLIGIFVWRSRVQRLKMPREPDTLLSVWLMLCDENNKVRAEFDGWETTGERERAKACRRRGAKYRGGWMQDQNGGGRWRWCVGVDGGGQEGLVVGYG